MKLENKLSKNALKQIKDRGISEKDILSSSPIDLSSDGEYVKGYIFFTKEKLGVMIMHLPGDYIKLFKGQY